MEIKVEKLMDNSPGSSLISLKDEGSLSLGEKFRRNIYIFFGRKSLAFPSFPFVSLRRDAGRERRESRYSSLPRDELLFYFSVIENQGARRLSIILEGARPLFPAGQSDFKNFRVSFAT